MSERNDILQRIPLPTLAGPLPTTGESAAAPGDAPDPDMAWIPGGTFRMGSEAFYPEERPVRRVQVDGFWIDRHQVTNERFARFVDATGYVTVAEIPPREEDYPGALPEMLVAGALVFHKTQGPVPLNDWSQWWRWVPGACWRHPEGPRSSIAQRMQHPVVQVSYADVEAYCAWAKKSLPTEAEWELAARGGLDGAAFTWGDEHFPGGKAMANSWQGEFPHQNLGLDGYQSTAPVGSYPPNGYGLYDMAGNVWEWTQDWYVATMGVQHKACCTPHNPRGAREDESYDPCDATPIARKVLKGGSFLCAPNYCLRYRPAARSPQATDTAMNHLGFRCIVRPSPRA